MVDLWIFAVCIKQQKEVIFFKSSKRHTFFFSTAGNKQNPAPSARVYSLKMEKNNFCVLFLVSWFLYVPCLLLAEISSLRYFHNFSLVKLENGGSMERWEIKFEFVLFCFVLLFFISFCSSKSDSFGEFSISLRFVYICKQIEKVFIIRIETWHMRSYFRPLPNFLLPHVQMSSTWI